MRSASRACASGVSAGIFPSGGSMTSEVLREVKPFGCFSDSQIALS
jgi:hypothetical protein